MSVVTINHQDLNEWSQGKRPPSPVARHFPPLVDVGGIMLANFDFMKIVPAAHIVSSHLKDGTLRDGDLIVESTSGNFGVGLARVWAARRDSSGSHNPLILITVPNGFPSPLAEELAALGVRVEVITERINGSFQIPRLRRLAEVIQEESQKRGKMPFWPEQYDNVSIREGYFEFAEYIAQQAHQYYGRWPDVLVSAIGTGASADGVSAVFRNHNPQMICACVDPQGSKVLGRRALANTTTRGSGGATKCRNTNYHGITHSHWVDRDQSVYQMLELKKQNVSVGFSAGGAFHVAQWYQRQMPKALVCILGADKRDRYEDDVLLPAKMKEFDIIPQDIREPEIILDPNVFTQPAHGWGWQMLEMTQHWKDTLTKEAQHDFMERRAIMCEKCPALESRP